MELLDGNSLLELDGCLGSDLATRGDALLLIQTDGLGAVAEALVIERALADLGGTVSSEDPEEAQRLLDLRGNSRGTEADPENRVGKDVPVPRSRLVEYCRVGADGQAAWATCTRPSGILARMRRA